jgi:hypothetical protein
MRSRSDSILRQGKGVATCRCPRLETVSPAGTTRQVDHVPYPQAIGNFPQLGAGGRKETAQQRPLIELLHPVVPALRGATQPLEDPRPAPP